MDGREDDEVEISMTDITQKTLDDEQLDTEGLSLIYDELRSYGLKKAEEEVTITIADLHLNLIRIYSHPHPSHFQTQTQIDAVSNDSYILPIDHTYVRILDQSPEFLDTEKPHYYVVDCGVIELAIVKFAVITQLLVILSKDLTNFLKEKNAAKTHKRKKVKTSLTQSSVSLTDSVTENAENLSLSQDFLQKKDS